VVSQNTGNFYQWLPMKKPLTDLVTLINSNAMKFEIDFSFCEYTKSDLIEFCFGKHADVDPAIQWSWFAKSRTSQMISTAISST